MVVPLISFSLISHTCTINQEHSLFILYCVEYSSSIFQISTSIYRLLHFPVAHRFYGGALQYTAATFLPLIHVWIHDHFNWTVQQTDLKSVCSTIVMKVWVYVWWPLVWTGQDTRHEKRRKKDVEKFSTWHSPTSNYPAYSTNIQHVGFEWCFIVDRISSTHPKAPSPANN